MIDGVVVESGPHAVRQRAPSGFVQAISPMPVTVERSVLSEWEACEYQVSVPKGRCISELAVEVVEGAVRHMCRWCAKAVSIEDLAHASGGHVEIVHRAEHLDVVVTGGSDIAKRSFEVASRVVAECV